MKRYSITEFNKQFPDDDACLEWLKNYVHPNGIFCRNCQDITPHSRLVKRKAYSCNKCGSHSYPMAGTIFEDSRTPLKYWFYAIFLMSATRCGISAKQLQRELGVTYKTAWRMFKQIRGILNEKTPPLDGIVEMDETYIGGHTDEAHKFDNKTPVIGAVDRDSGIAKANAVPNLSHDNVMPFINKNISKMSIVCTDDASSFARLGSKGYAHREVNHSAGEYVKGYIHTNTIEGFWSSLKRGIDGVYHHVSPKYLQNYIHEYQFRYNHRKDERAMFETFLTRI
jgi:transposase